MPIRDRIERNTQVLAPGNGKTKTGRLWVYVRDDRHAGSSLPAGVWFAYSADRKGEHPQHHLAKYQGVNAKIIGRFSPFLMSAIGH